MIRIDSQKEAFNFLYELEKSLRTRGLSEVSDHLAHFLQGAGAATGSERMCEMVRGLAELLEKFKQDLSEDEARGVDRAKAVYYELS